MVKAMKADDAAVPVHLWDKAVRRGLPSPDEKMDLTIMRDLLLRKYRLHLWRDARQFLCQTYENTWSSKIHVLKLEVKEDADAIQDILWRAAAQVLLHPSQKGSLSNVCRQGANIQATTTTPKTQQEEGATSQDHEVH